MTEIVVALDGPQPKALLEGLRRTVGLRWAKIGPAAMTSTDWPGLVRAVGVSIFADLKLCDTAAAVELAVRRLAVAGVAAVSTSTDEATEAALEAAVGYPLLVWQLISLTTENAEYLPGRSADEFGAADGLICPLHLVSRVKAFWPAKPIICPGIRLTRDDDFGGHRHKATVAEAARAGVDFLVMGQPFWQASDPTEVYRDVQKQICQARNP